MLVSMLMRAVSQVDDGTLGLFFFVASQVAVAFSADLVGGMVEVDGPSLFGCGWTAVLSLSTFVLAPLSASLAFWAKRA
jgi:hypothetical protein